MKITLPLLFIIATTSVYAQDEFGSTTFYEAVRKVQQQGLTGFEQLKGKALQSQYPELRKEFNTLVLLPLADSGKVIVPQEGSPMAVFYFEPEKKLEKINERAASLREALSQAHSKPLYARTTTTTEGKKIYSDTYYYDDPNEKHTSKAVFRSTIYRQKKKYFLMVEIRGK